MHILVTGGAGYIGSILTAALLDGGHRVVVLDNFMYRQNSLGHLCAHPNLSIVRGDVRDVEFAPLLRDVDVVIPLAAIVGAPACEADKVAAMSTNTDAIHALSDLMRPEQRLIIPISNSGYGVGEADKACTEESPLKPISVYGLSKVDAEALALERENTISLRLATVFGMSPRMRLDLLVNDFVYRAVTDRALVLFEADFRRNFIHVRDVASAFLFAMVNFERMRGQVYNVGLSSANLTKRQLCEKIATWVPGFQYVEAPIGKDPDQRDYIVSNAKIEALGWNPALDLDFGIQELLKGYQMLRRSEHANF